MTLAEYSTPDAVKAWQDFWPIILATAAGLLWLWRRLKRWKADLIKEIRQATKPIQPTSNGGLSLPDLHKKVDDLADTVADVQREQSNTNAVVLEHIANHRDHSPPGTNPRT